MAKKEENDDYFIELDRDLGFRGAHLGRGFILDGNMDRPWAEHLVAMGKAKKVDKPEHTLERPWDEIRDALAAEAKAKAATLHPTAPRAYGNAPQKK